MSFPRYPAYKDSGVEWVGQVPDHWEVGPVKRFFKVLDGLRVPLSTEERSYRQGNFPYYGASGIIDYVDDFIFDEDMVLVSEDGANLLARATPIAFVAKGRYWVNNHAHILKAPDDALTFWSERIEAIDLTPVVTGAAQPKLTIDALANLVIAVPPTHDERKRIARFVETELTRIDALVAEQEQLITLLKEKRQAVISHAATKGLDPSVPMKDSGVEWLGEVPAHWNVSPLKFLARIGNGSTPNRDNPNYWADEGFPWLNSSVVNQNEVSEAERFVTQTALDECHLPIIAPPAILVGITGQGKTRGMAAPLAFTATVNQHLAYIKPDLARLSVEFLLRVLEAAYEDLRTESEGAGSTKGAITCGQLGAWFVPLPAQEEQSKIISFLDSELTKLDALTAEAEDGIELLRERRSALISAAVTGQIDVRTLESAHAA